MEILLIFAKSAPRRGTRLKHFMVPPHSLQLIAAMTPKPHRVRILDDYHRNVPTDLRADLVGIGVWTASAGRAYEIADAYRRRGVPVVMGGLHVSLCPDEALAHADAVVIGEAESVWKQVVGDAQNNRLKRMYTATTRPLAETPAPDWTAFNERSYILTSSVAASRGCVRRCDFCCESCKPKPNYRMRPLDRVLDEIDSRSSKVVAFLDNDLLVNRPYAVKLLTALKNRKLSWFGMTSIETAADEALLDLMAESGCRTLFIGFESLNADSLSEVNKKCNQVDNYRRNIRRLHDRGIMINASFVFGFDNDTPAVFDETVDFAVDANLETATFTILTPYPGTVLHERLTAEGRILHRDWSRYDTTHVVFLPKGMTKAELEAGYYRAYNRFYSVASIVKRCRPGVPGFAKRLALNIAYKKIEPVHRLLAHPVPSGFLRFLMRWYAAPDSSAGPRRNDASGVFQEGAGFGKPPGAAGLYHPSFKTDAGDGRTTTFQ